MTTVVERSKQMIFRETFDRSVNNLDEKSGFTRRLTGIRSSAVRPVANTFVRGGVMSRRLPRLVLFVVVTLFPAMLYAQASITGTVKDNSGAVLPGVTVEASSPALIEKTRSAVTDG